MSGGGKIGVVLPAGGLGLRVGGVVPKQFIALQEEKPLFHYPLEMFHSLDAVAEIVVVLPESHLSRFADLGDKFPKVRFVIGGTERWQSVRNGVLSLEPAITHILVHDAARPFVSKSLIQRCLNELARENCVVAALPAVDTIKEIAGEAVTRTLDRRRLIMVQTPQGFPRKVLESIYAHLDLTSPVAATDEAQLAESFGYTIKWVQGTDLNRKITTSEDLQWGEWIADRIRTGEVSLDD